MKTEKIVLEIINIDKYFRGEELVDNPDNENDALLDEDQWTHYLKGYMGADQKDMAQLIGKINQLNWREEDKLWWNVLLASRCEGSDQYMHELERMLKKFKHENHILEELLTGVGRILIDRESQSREKAYQSEMKKLFDIADIKEQKTNEARENLQRHEQTRNR